MIVMNVRAFNSAYTCTLLNPNLGYSNV